MFLRMTTVFIGGSVTVMATGYRCMTGQSPLCNRLRRVNTVRRSFNIDDVDRCTQETTLVCIEHHSSLWIEPTHRMAIVLFRRIYQYKVSTTTNL